MEHRVFGRVIDPAAPVQHVLGTLRGWADHGLRITEADGQDTEVSFGLMGNHLANALRDQARRWLGEKVSCTYRPRALVFTRLSS